jgi:hypothetical protein
MPLGALDCAIYVGIFSSAACPATWCNLCLCAARVVGHGQQHVLILSDGVLASAVAVLDELARNLPIAAAEIILRQVLRPEQFLVLSYSARMTRCGRPTAFNLRSGAPDAEHVSVELVRKHELEIPAFPARKPLQCAVLPFCALHNSTCEIHKQILAYIQRCHTLATSLLKVALVHRATHVLGDLSCCTRLGVGSATVDRVLHVKLLMLDR